MPELPEVETVRKGLELTLNDFYIDRVSVLSESLIASPGGANTFITKLEGSLVGPWMRRGKYLLASLSNNSKHFGWWGVHLRMTGHFQWYLEEKAICKHTRIRFWDKSNRELRFIDIRKFAQMWWVPPESSPEEIIKGLKRLGPEPFSKDFNPSYLKKCLKRTKRPIKSAILDQSIVAGAGNIYADESLFEAGICPKKTALELKEEEISKLCQSLKKILKASIGKGGTTFSDFRNLEGGNGKYGEEAMVYRRTKRPCNICGTKIIKEKLSGRSTHWCPNCQKN